MSCAGQRHAARENTNPAIVNDNDTGAASERDWLSNDTYVMSDNMTNRDRVLRP